MRKWILPASLALIVGACGKDSHNGDTAPTPEFLTAPASCDYTGNTHICVAWDDGVARDPDGVQYELTWATVAGCMISNYGLPGTPGPTVRVTAHELTFPDGTTHDGATDLTPGTPGLVVIFRFDTAAAHEFVHYFLKRAGFPTDDNQNHRHPGFTTCGQFT